MCSTMTQAQRRFRKQKPEEVDAIIDKETDNIWYSKHIEVSNVDALNRGACFERVLEGPGGDHAWPTGEDAAQRLNA